VPAEVRSRIVARSNSANEPMICIIMRPAGVVVSMFSVIDRKPAPARAIRSMMCSTSFSEGERRSSFQTTTASPSRSAPAYGAARVGPNGQGEIRDRTFENQSFRSSGLSLIAAAIVHWNTVYLDRARPAPACPGCHYSRRSPRARRAPRMGAHRAHRRLHLERQQPQHRLPAATRCSHGVLAANRLVCSFEQIVQRPHVARQQGWQGKGADLRQHLGSNNRPDVAATSRCGG